MLLDLGKPTLIFFFLLSHELRGERYEKKWLRIDFHGFKMPPVRDPTP